MFKIGEFSKLTQVSIRMLRYYDETGLLKPAEIDRFTGYRSYSIDQIPRLRRIIFLRDTGFQVAEISAALKQWDDGNLAWELKKSRGTFWQWSGRKNCVPLKSVRQSKT